MIEQEILSALQREMESSPQSAVDRVSTLDDSISSRQIKGSIFIDAGVMLGDAEVITKGIEIQKSLIADLPDYAHHFSYNLANGLFNLALITKRPDPEWYTETHEYRFKARKEFYNVTQYDAADYDLKSQSYTNLANLLRESYRWVEAYEFYMEALNENSFNSVASSGAAKLLYDYFMLGVGRKEETAQEIKELIHHAIENEQYFLKASGQQNFIFLKKQLEKITDSLEKIRCDTQKQNPEQKINNKRLLRFCHKERLFLNLSLNYHKSSLASICDDLCISSVLETAHDDSLVPTVFKLLNLLKSDFILARHLLLEGIDEKIQETGRYDFTIDYSIYGVNSSAIVTAQRIAVDLLDKVGVAIRLYLGIGGAKNTDFQKFWSKKVKEGGISIERQLS